MSWYGDAWDSVTGFVGGATKKTASLGENIAQVASMPLGLGFDAVRYLTPLDNDAGPDWLGTTKSIGAGGEILGGENTLTGWAFNKAYAGVNFAVFDPVETYLNYTSSRGGVWGNPGALFWDGEDPISWGEAWDLARNRTPADQAVMEINNGLFTAGDTLGASPESVSRGVRSLPLVGQPLESAGIGDPKNYGINITEPVRQEGGTVIDPAWEQFYSDSPLATGVLKSGIDFYLLYKTDPFVIGSKLTTPLRNFRNNRPVKPGEEGSLAELMASQESASFGPFSFKKAGLQSRTDPLIGTVKYEDRLDPVTGQPVIDDFGDVAQVGVVDKPGWLDTHPTEAQIYTGLGLNRHAMGTDIAAVLAGTAKIKDAGARVNIRRDILATLGGDQNALQRLAIQNNIRTASGARYNGREIANVLSNMFRGRGSGSIELGLADEAKIAATGSHVPTSLQPEAVAGMADELNAQQGFESWAYAIMKDRTFRVSAKGNRAVARLAGQGLGRDGTLHTGWTGLDRVVNDRALGKFKSNGSMVDDGVASSRALDAAEPTGLAAGKVYTPNSVSWRRGPFQQAASVTGKNLIRVAGWATINPAKAGAKMSDALRGRVVMGALNVEDKALSVAVTQEFLRRAGVDAAKADQFLSSVVRAESPTARAIAIQKAQNLAIQTLAQRYGVTDEAIAKIASMHAERQQATMSAIQGQVYSAHTKPTPDGRKGRGDVIYLPDDGGMIVGPILDTQTINNLPLLDLAYVEKWLRRDKTLAHVSQMVKNFAGGGNPRVTAATEMGFNSRATERIEEMSNRLIRYYADDVNSWWKRGVLQLRAPSYAIRNLTEEVMRVWASGWTAMTLDNAMRQVGHDWREFKRLKFKQGEKHPERFEDIVPQYATRQVRRDELASLTARYEDSELRDLYLEAKGELRSLNGKRGAAIKAGDQAKVAELDAIIADVKMRPEIAEYEDWADQISDLQRELKALDAVIAQRVLPMSGEREVAGVAMPDAFAGVGGRQAYDIIRNSGAFDRELVELTGREYRRTKGFSDQGVIDVFNPVVANDPIQEARHMHAWSWILNRQIRQDPAARIALEGMARGEGDVAELVTNWLKSPDAANYRRGNPHRSHDLEEWGEDIADMVTHHIGVGGDGSLAESLLKSDVAQDELRAAFPEVSTRPSVHTTDASVLFGSKRKTLAERSSEFFRLIDKMSVHRFTRHPVYAATYRAEQERLAADYLRKAKAQFGESATFTADDINTIAAKARQTALKTVKDTFYNTLSRSNAAQQLRFMFPFFSAHQDSMTFWGRTIARNPEILRKLQLTFNIPYMLGIVTDRDGNVIEETGIPSPDHVMWLQLPPGWGGPDLNDPTAKRSRFTLNPTSFNLILQNGGILNPGAGPMAAIPVGALQKHLAGSSEDLSKMMEFFSPYGAPKDADNPFLGETFGWLDPALPTPVKRLAALFGSRETLEVYNKLSVEKYVEFVQKHDRPPTDTEIREMSTEVRDRVRGITQLRFAASFFSPVQPQPATVYEGFRQEFRRLQDQAQAEGRGSAWAIDQFTERYGDEYYALTKSASLNRARLRGTPEEVSALRANSKLAELTNPEVWRVIIGPEGEGEFNFDARRWMESKTVGPDGEKLIDRKGIMEQLTDDSIQMGWRAYTKLNMQLQAIATQHGLTSYAESPQLVALRRGAIKELEELYKDWAAVRGPQNDFESTMLPSLELIANNKKLLSDPGRGDIQVLREYVEGRKAVAAILKQAGAAGGSYEESAKANAPLMYGFAMFVSQLIEKNTAFQEYAIEGIISRDPLYRAAMDVMEAAHGAK